MKRHLQALADIRAGIELGKIAARIYGPDSADRYGWTLRPDIKREAFWRTYVGARSRAGVPSEADMAIADMDPEW